MGTKDDIQIIGPDRRVELFRPPRRRKDYTVKLLDRGASRSRKFSVRKKALDFAYRQAGWI